MGKNKNPTTIKEIDLKPSNDQYGNVSLWSLKRIDEEYRTRKKYLPYSQETWEALLFYLSAFVTDGDLAEKEGRRITILIKRQLSRMNKNKPLSSQA